MTAPGRYAILLLAALTGFCQTAAPPVPLLAHERPVFNAHDGWITGLAFSPDGKILASAGYEPLVKLWDVASGKELRSLKGHTKWIRFVMFTPDGKRLYSTSEDNDIRLWDVATGENLGTFVGHTEVPRAIALSPDGKTLMSGSWDRTIRFWDVATFKEIRRLTGHTKHIRGLALSPDGKTLASGGEDEIAILWDVATGQQRFVLKPKVVLHCVLFTPDGKTLITGGQDGRIALWDVATGKDVGQLIGHVPPGPVLELGITSDGKYLASGCFDKTAKVWDLAARKEVLTVDGFLQGVRSVAISGDGKALAAGSMKIMKMWDITKGQLGDRPSAQLHAPPLEPGEPAQTGMTNIGEVLQLPPFGASYKAAIDPAAGFAYFGAAGPINPSILSKIDVRGPLPKLVQDGEPNPISKGMVAMLGVEVDTSDADPLKHFIYGGMSSGEVMKFAPGDPSATPRLISTLHPTSASGTIMCSTIDISSADPNEHYLYLGVAGRRPAPPKILRIRLSDFTDQGSETIDIRSIRYCAIDPVHHYAYFTDFGNQTRGKVAPQIAKVNLATFHDGGASAATYTFDSTDWRDGLGRTGSDYPNFDQGFVIDPVHAFAYIGTYNSDQAPGHPKADTWPYNQAMVVQMKLGTGDSFPAHPVAVLSLRIGERNLAAAVFDSKNGDVYFGTDNCYPGHVYKIHVGDGRAAPQEIGRLDLNPGSLTTYPRDGDTVPGNRVELYGESYLRAAVIDEKHNAIYFGTDSVPGQVIKVGINGSQRVTDLP